MKIPNRILTFIIKYRYVLYLALPFIAIDLLTRVVGADINYYRAEMVFPNILFTISWIAFFVAIILSLRGILGKILYLALSIIFFAMFFSNGVYYNVTGFSFSFNLVLMAGEGSSYILDAIKNTPVSVFLYAACIIILIIFAFIHIPKKEKTNFISLIITLVIFIIIHSVTPLFLGKANSSLEWDSWRNPRNVYNNFNDSNKCIKICGIYEYTVRDFYITFLKQDTDEDPEELEELDELYSETTTNEENNYTGIFEGKNVIFLQLEGMDSWLLNETDTPTLYKLMQESINFENHYSYYNGGGSTFNSEFAVNTGFITPISYTENAYSFNTNTFTYSLANMFSASGYSVNAFHMNTGEYYQRSLNYSNWGYDNYYSLLDLNDYDDDDLTYELDRELILDETFYNAMFEGDEPFLHYIITFTPHTPFTTSKGVGKLLAEYEYGEDNIPDLSEEECAKLMASETDYMVELLLQALEDNDLLDDTVIVAYADHYLYTLSDKSILEQYKNTDNNLINNTPFFIWSSDIEPETVTKVNSQLDILPTVLNMFGYEYITDYYIGNDIFDPDYTGYVFFDDYSWYDGNVYVENGVVTYSATDNSEDSSVVLSLNNTINRLIRKNDLTLKYDYFKNN